MKFDIGKMYVLQAGENVSFYLYDENQTKIIGKLLPYKPFVILNLVHRENRSWNYIIKILTNDAILGWMSATEHYTDFIKPIKELEDCEESIIQ